MHRIEYLPLAESDLDAVCDLFAPAFAHDDPLAKSQGITETDFAALLRSIYPQLLADGLSRVAHDTRNGQLVAGVLADRAGPGEEGSDAIAALIETAQTRYRQSSHHARGTCAHIHFVASRREFRRHGLVETLAQQCCEQARVAGCESVVVEASGVRSRRLFRERLGFSEVCVVPYADFEYHGNRPFAGIA